MQAKGSDAQLLLKSSIDDMMVLREENAKLKEKLESKGFEARYCTT